MSIHVDRITVAAPDQDALTLWNSTAAKQRRPLEEEIGRLQAELDEIKGFKWKQ